MKRSTVRFYDYSLARSNLLGISKSAADWLGNPAYVKFLRSAGRMYIIPCRASDYGAHRISGNAVCISGAYAGGNFPREIADGEHHEAKRCMVSGKRAVYVEYSVPNDEGKKMPPSVCKTESGDEKPQRHKGDSASPLYQKGG